MVGLHVDPRLRFQPTTLVTCLTAAAIVAALSTATPALAATITKEALKIDGESRTYYLFVPETVGAEAVPLVITLHGSGRDGRTLVDLFRGLASSERFIVVGPDSADRRGWQVPGDGPAFLYFLVEALKTKHQIDGHRVYLFGHSAGASFALTMGLLESEYFAGVASHAVTLQREDRNQLLAAPRKMPMALLHGTSDSTIPIARAREARDILIGAGFDVHLRELGGFEHNTIYTRGESVVRPAWEFLKSKALEQEPRYQAYTY